MQRGYYKVLVLLVTFGLIGCNAANEGSHNNQQDFSQERNVYESDSAHLQPFNNTHTTQRAQRRSGKTDYQGTLGAKQ